VSKQLVRGLGLVDAASLVVGTIIGTGVFLKSATMAQTLGSPGLVLAAWAAAGLLSLAGALTYAELGSLYPHAGGEYVYLKESYGELPAFLYGWMRFWIASPGTIAAYAMGAATFLKGVVPFQGSDVWIALTFIWIFSIINCFQVSVGGRINSFVTGLKLFMMLGLIIGVLFFSDQSSFSHLATPETATGFKFSTFGLAMLSALWAYDGWNNLPMAAGEVRNPERNLPLSLSLGVLTVLAIYLVVNLGYFLALPFDVALTANSDQNPQALPIASMAAQTFLGPAGIGVVSVLFVISALGAMNGSILTSARVPYAMSQDALFFRALGLLHEKSQVPVVSVIFQGLIATALAMWGTFDQLTNYVIFASWLFYGLVASAVIRLRKKNTVPRTYKTVGYPVVPIVFISLSFFLVINTVIEMPKDSAIGLAFVLSGVPVFYFFRNRWSK
jgi:basic amino acid/polyamine antiporter, APA family